MKERFCARGREKKNTQVIRANIIVKSLAGERGSLCLVLRARIHFCTSLEIMIE